MSDYREKQVIFQQDAPVKRARPVETQQYDSVVREHRGISGAAVAALVIASIAVAIVITMLVMNNQQRNLEDQLAIERAKNAAAQQMPTQQPPTQPLQQPTQQPVPNVLPSTPPATAPSTLSPSSPAPTPAEPSNADLEGRIVSKIVGDEELRSYAIDVKVGSGVATLTGEVPNDELKAKAEKLARSVKGIRGVVNRIQVEQ